MNELQKYSYHSKFAPVELMDFKSSYIILNSPNVYIIDLKIIHTVWSSLLLK